jgi:hypothetical protein
MSKTLIIVGISLAALMARRAYPDGKLHLYFLAAMSAFTVSGLVIAGLLTAQWIAVNQAP